MSDGMGNIERAMVSPLAEIARLTYADEIPDDLRETFLAYVREAVDIDRRERARHQGAVEALRECVKRAEGANARAQWVAEPAQAALDHLRGQ
jgi:transcription initiation factor TFIIIB Brf1 subunit/transcription initiation factor TFIIB